MSIPLLAQAAGELRRIAIAGAPLAHDDYRIRRLLEPLRRSAERAPVFGKAADLLDELISGPREQAPATLLRSISLVNAVLYTQGQVGCSGDLLDLPDTGQDLQETTVPARSLKPVLEALSSVGSGRLAIITEAVERGLFRDPRLVRVAVQALDDTYAEIADLVADRILPAYGRAIVPTLEARLQLDGGAKDARCLRALAAILGREGWDRYREALATGSKPVRVCAVQCLAPYVEALPMLKELTNDRQAEVREAALLAISGHGDADAVPILLQAIAGPDLQRSIAAARSCHDPAFVTGLIDTCQEELDAALAAKEVTATAMQRLALLLACFPGRHDAATIAFCSAQLARAGSIAALKAKNGYQDGLGLLRQIGELLVDDGMPPEAGRALLDLREDGPVDLLLLSTRAGHRLLSAAEFHKAFAPLATATGKGQKLRAKAVLQALHSIAADRLHPLWLDLAVKLGQTLLVARLARPGHAAAIAHLREALAKKQEWYEAAQVLEALIRCQIPDVDEVFCAALTKNLKSQSRTWFVGYHLLPLIPQLPPSVVPRLEALAVDLPDSLANELVEALQPLRAQLEGTPA